MRIAVIGSGYVGLVSAACFAELGHEVVAVDNNEAKIAMLIRGQVPIYEQILPQLLNRHRGRRLTFSISIREAIQGADAVFIAVGTPPSATGEADLSFVEAVASETAKAIHGRTVIVEKSTVPVRTCEWLRNCLLLNGAKPGSFSVASNPEFLREGTAVTDFMYPDRIVVGADDDFSAAIMQKVYEPLTTGSYYRQENIVPSPGGTRTQTNIIVTSAKSAELIKHASNAFLAMKISFVNAVANIAESVGADINQVCWGVGSDARIGPTFLHAGIGYGGSCFPKDVRAFQAVASHCGYELGLLTEVMRINAGQRQLFLKKVRSALWTLRGKKLAALGLAFKGDTDDVRESPAIEIIEALLREGAQVRVYDPAASLNAQVTLPALAIEYANDPYDAVAGSDALLILTDWKEFACLDLHQLRELLKYPIVIDGRNLYEPQEMADAGLIYYSVGRPVGVPKQLSSLATNLMEESESTAAFVESIAMSRATSIL